MDFRSLLACLPILSLEGILCLSLLSVTLSAQETVWEKYMGDAQKAYEQALYGEAEQLYLAALKEAENFEDEDRRLATSLNNLGRLYSAQGKYVQAESLYRRAVAVWEKTLGAEHPDVATGLSNLAKLYYIQGKYSQLEPLYQRVLAIRERAFGVHHSSVVQTLESYTALLRKQNREAEAKRVEDRFR